MMWLEFLRVAFGSLRAHKFRAVLTVLSITIGAFSVVVMSSLARSGTATLARGVEEVGGARIVALFPSRPEKAERKQASYFRGLTLADAEALRARVPHLRYVSVQATLDDRDVSVEGAPGRKSADLVGANQDFLPAMGMRLAAGRAVNAEDLLAQRRVVVIGHGVAQRLFPDANSALGRVLRVGNDSFRVIGVVAEVKRFGVKFGFDWNDFICAPITTVSSGGDMMIVMVTESADKNDVVKRLANLIVADRHRQVDDFKVFDFAVIVAKFEEVFHVMHLIVAGIASIALLVGGMGVMNILLVSVSERVREIGIRKTLGASDRAIGTQFLFESALLSGLGGAVGVLLGSATAMLVGRIIASKEQAWTPVLAVEAVTGALLTSLLIGVFFGLVPARKAARLTVVDCLRAGG
jgi:putative ABC transport system permease protein